MAGLLLGGHLALVGCAKPPPEPAAPTHAVVATAPAPEPEIPPAPVVVPVLAAEEVVGTVQEVVDAVPLPEPPPPPPAAAATPLSDAGIKLLVDTETGGEKMYRRKFTRPVWPGGSSGVTIGIGVDLGQMGREEIRYDWEKHPQLDELYPAAGIAGQQAKILTAKMQGIVTEYPLALDVFLRNDVLQYYRITARSFPGLDRLGANAQGALVSLVFNRGGVIPATCTPGTSRYEMCMIRDECMALEAEAGPCVARWLRVMKRVWKGKDIERGMNSRREQEAKLAELPDV